MAHGTVPHLERGTSVACVDDAYYLGWQATTRTRQGLPCAIRARQVSSREEQKALDDKGHDRAGGGAHACAG